VSGSSFLQDESIRAKLATIAQVENMIRFICESFSQEKEVVRLQK
jgi:hypothetical protein